MSQCTLHQMHEDALTLKTNYKGKETVVIKTAQFKNKIQLKESTNCSGWIWGRNIPTS